MVVVALFAAACGGQLGRTSGSPNSAVKAWIGASRSGDARAGYALLAESVRRKVSYDVFARHWNDTRAEREEQLRSMETDLREDPQIGQRAQITLADGK